MGILCSFCSIFYKPKLLKEIKPINLSNYDIFDNVGNDNDS